MRPSYSHSTHQQLPDLTSNTMPTFSLLFFSTCLLFLLPSLGVSLETHLIQVESLLPSTTCNPSPLGEKEKGAASLELELVHKNGPCSNMDWSPIDTAQILQLDQSRARSIQSSVAPIPVKHGAVAAAGDYVVKLGLGTPKKVVTLVVDTWSDSVWTQCKKHAAFDPFVSKSYANVSCERASCNAFRYMAGVLWDCIASTCSYSINYREKSMYEGFLANEKLTIGSKSFYEFYFVCAQKSNGSFAGASGVLGLSKGDFSINAQLEEKYGNVFSYCLPSKPSYVGRLIIGKGGVSKSVKYTPLVTKSAHLNKYIVEVIAISVGGVKLGIPPTVLSASGTVIDSGTAISRLPSRVYLTLSAVFGHAMAKYPKAKPLSILDLCYNFKGFKQVSVPKISFIFKGGVEVPLHSSGILIGNGVERMCLAFAASEKESDVSILGNVQQRTLDVVYDVKGGKIGFGVNGCH